MSDLQVSDETLEAWFSAAAAPYEVPSFDAVLEAAGESAQVKSSRFQRPRLVAAAVLLIAAAGGASLWTGVGQHGADTTAVKGGPAPIVPATLHGGPSKTKGSPSLSYGQSTDSARLPPAAARAAAPAGGDSVTFADQSGLAGQLTSSAPLSPSAVDGAKIVHTGSLGLTVAKGQVSTVLTRLTGLATGFGGYVSSSTTAETGSRPTGTVVLRVPAGSYDTALAQARTFGTVTSTASSAQDVTGSYTDLQARETALTKTRDHYLTLLTKAKTIGETLSVQQRIDDAQTQIDQLQGQINVLGDQASYGTLTVTVQQKVAAVIPPKIAPVHHESGLSKSWHSAKTGFVTGVEALVARSGRALVVLLVLVALLAVLRIAWRVGRRRLV